MSGRFHFDDIEMVPIRRSTESAPAAQPDPSTEAATPGIIDQQQQQPAVAPPATGTDQQQPAAEERNDAVLDIATVDPTTGLIMGSPADLAWKQSEVNPMNWPPRVKSFFALLMSFAAITASMGATLYIPQLAEVIVLFDVDGIVATMPTMTYLLGLAVGSVLAGPLSETVGHRLVWIGSIFFGMVCSLVAICMKNMATLCVIRFFSGFSLSPCLVLGYGVLSGMFSVEKRGFSVSAYLIIMFVGLSFGAVGGIVLEFNDVEFLIIILGGISFLMASLAPETHHQTIIVRCFHRLGLQEAPPRLRPAQLVNHFFARSLMRPLCMVVAEPITALMAVATGCQFAQVFVFVTALPQILFYGAKFTSTQVGGAFLAIAVGSLAGYIAVVAHLTRSAAAPTPERRLGPGLYFGPLVPLAAVCFVVTAELSKSVVWPMVSLFVWGMANCATFVSAGQYLADCYPSHYVASAASSNAFVRHIVAAGVVILALPMISELGISVVVCAFYCPMSLLTVFAFAYTYKFGKELRGRSNYQAVL